MKVLLTPEAEADLEGIGDRIAEGNPARAVTYVRELRERTSRIGDFPHAGPLRAKWGEGIRIVAYGKYLIVYRVRDEIVQIARVVHGARDLDALFERSRRPSDRSDRSYELIPQHLFPNPRSRRRWADTSSRGKPSARSGRAVLAKCYGGDITRKRKLLESWRSRRQEAHAPVRPGGDPQEAFVAALKMDEN